MTSTFNFAAPPNPSKPNLGPPAGPHTSTLKLIRARFGVPVPNLTAWRDATVGDMTSTFNFAAPPNPSKPNLRSANQESVPWCCPGRRKVARIGLEGWSQLVAGAPGDTRCRWWPAAAPRGRSASAAVGESGIGALVLPRAPEGGPNWPRRLVPISCRGFGEQQRELHICRAPSSHRCSSSCKRVSPSWRTPSAGIGG